jgi:hypothetical protein
VTGISPSLAWLDHSEYDRRRAIEVIKLFEEKGTVDELGVGTVRDAISDLLFPGTSVLHPRARYYLIVPWVYRHLESKRTPSSEIEAKGRQMELGLIDQIMASDDSQSAIGRQVGKRLKVLPSAMYWSGLEAWGIRLFHGTQYHYRRALDRIYREQAAATVRNDDREPTGTSFRTWHASLPKAPSGFGREPLSLRLTREESEYLVERLMTRCRGSLLAHLVDRCAPAPDTSMVWEHPQFGNFPAELRSQVEHARNLSLSMHGATLLYNLMLAEKKDGLEELAKQYRKDLAEWVAEVRAASRELARWDRAAFWTLVLRAGGRVTPATRAFVDQWLDLALGSDAAKATKSEPTRALLAERELRLKGQLARLHSPTALKQWQGASGLTRMSYRWNPQIRQVTTDIQRGLGRA